MPPSPSSWFVYILECSDKTLYTGITTNLDRRLKEHNSGSGAKYTKRRRPVRLVYYEPSPNRSEASKRESVIKKQTRRWKQNLISTAIASM